MSKSHEAILLSVAKQGKERLRIEALTERYGRIQCEAAIAGKKMPMLLPGCTMQLETEPGPIKPGQEVAIAKTSGGIIAAGNDDVSILALMAVRAFAARFLEIGRGVGQLYDATQSLIHSFVVEDGRWPVHYVAWEMALARRLSFVTGFERCEADFRHGETIYFSPRTGKLASRAEAGAFLDRMLPVPAFLMGGSRASVADVRQGVELMTRVLVTFGLDTADDSLPHEREDMLYAIEQVREIPRESLAVEPQVDEEARRQRLLSLRPLTVGHRFDA